MQQRMLSRILSEVKHIKHLSMNTAILFDTMSIQQYVFGSNKLKDNLGASYIIEHIYDTLKIKAENLTQELDIGYIGGGNALFFTSSVSYAKKIIKEYTTMLIYNYPGANVSVAILEGFANDDIDYSLKIKELFNLLAENKGKYIPVNIISSHGITDVCQFSSFSAEKIDKNGTLISSSTASKRINEKYTKNEDATLLSGKLSNYSFPYEFDNLGQKKNEDSHIAIVHIDGNGFGSIFRELNNVNQTFDLSNRVKMVVRETFVHILKLYIENKDLFKDFIEKDSFNDTLPIRPIILGGDDVTFVCHGKLGLWFAENFMEKFSSNFIDSDKKIQFSSCAGVVIVKNKYPFYRAYQMAAELCDSAKRKNKDKGGNWIDFQLAYSGLGNTLDEIRKLQYKDITGFVRPYCIDDISTNISFSELKKYTCLLKDTLPNSKIKDLREIITKDVSSQTNFIEFLKYHSDEKEGFRDKMCNNLTNTQILHQYPFFDMIELLDLYPHKLLK